MIFLLVQVKYLNQQRFNLFRIDFHEKLKVKVVQVGFRRSDKYLYVSIVQLVELNEFSNEGEVDLLGLATREFGLQISLEQIEISVLDFLNDGLVHHVDPVGGEEGYGGEKEQNVLVILPDTAER